MTEDGRWQNSSVDGRTLQVAADSTGRKTNDSEGTFAFHPCGSLPTLSWSVNPQPKPSPAEVSNDRAASTGLGVTRACDDWGFVFE